MLKELAPDIQRIHIHEIVVLCIDEKVKSTGKDEHHGKNQTDPEERVEILIVNDLVDHDSGQNREDHIQRCVKEPAAVEHDEIFPVTAYVS